MKKMLPWFCGLWVLLIPFVSHSEEPQTTLEDVVVTATRYAEQTFGVPANVTVLGRKDFQRSTAVDIPGVLRELAGVHITDLSGNGRTYRVDLRGFGETAQSNTLVLVDGRRVNQADLSGTDWALIPLEQVERVEIIENGRGSVLYGDNASGGVINIITRRAPGEKVLDFRVSGGSFGTAGGDIYGGASAGPVTFSVSANSRNSEGYRDNSETEYQNAGINVDYQVGDRASIQLDGGFHSDNYQLPGAIPVSQLEAGFPRDGTLHPDDYSDIDDNYIKLKPEIYLPGDSRLEIDFSYRQRESLFFSTFTGGAFEGDTEIDTTVVSPQLVVQRPLFGRGNSLVMGLDYTDVTEDIDNTSIFFGTETVGVFRLEKENAGFFVHDRFEVTDTVSVSAGYRHDQVTFSFEPSDQQEIDRDADLFTAGIGWDVTDKAFLFGSWSRSFRYPLLDELYSFFTNTVNTSLKEQFSDDFSVGARYAFDDTLSVEINLFRIDTEDEIYFNPSTFANENLDGETRRQGVGLSLSKDFSRARLTCGYRYTDAEIMDGAYEGNTIPSVPKNKFTLGASANLGWGFTLSADGIYVGKQYYESDFANSFEERDDYVVINLKLRYEWKNWTVFLDCRNLTDEEYSEFGVLSGTPPEPSVYPSPERNFMLGLSASF